jgi:primosomal protein N' (replication factor Y)
MPRVTLVGVINADISLHMPDFRSAERTFQLVAQVAGRAGRGDLGGEVLVQTLSPSHYSIVCASCHDYGSFYRQEMKIRKSLKYPPFVRLARVLVSGREEEEVRVLAERWASLLAGASTGGRGIDVLGPAPAPLARAKDRYRYHVIVKSESGNRLRSLLQEVMAGVEASRNGNRANAVVDIDPQNLM